MPDLLFIVGPNPHVLYARDSESCRTNRTTRLLFIFSLLGFSRHLNGPISANK